MDTTIKPRIKILDNQFSHSNGGSFGTGDLNILPTHFSWYTGQDIVSKVCVFTESCMHLVDNVSEQFKVAILLEPPSINSDSYQWIKINYDKFTHIFTHQRFLLELSDKFILYEFGGCWIKEDDWSIYEKTKEISIICSDKRQTAGHMLRHEVIKNLSKRYNIDIFGRGYNYIDYKLSALKDYKYTIVIENEQSDCWFTEKLIDAFACGTMPIYWGCPLIGEHFDKVGILPVNTLNDIQSLLIHINSGFINYENKLQAIKNNFGYAQKYAIPEDLLWQNLLCELV